LTDGACGYALDGVPCGKPAVEHVDIFVHGSRNRMFLCADHSDHRETLLSADWGDSGIRAS